MDVGMPINWDFMSDGVMFYAWTSAAQIQLDTFGILFLQ